MDRLPEDELLDASTYLNVGIDHYNAGELPEALKEFESVVARFPDDAEGYYYRGLVLLGQGENERAAADLNKVLELDPDGPHTSEVTEFLEFLESSEG
jgi:tetratricopeptide (TPR) repeat protein